MLYEDFSIRILPRAGGVYTVHVSSPAGEASSTLELPFDLDEVGEVLRGLASTVRGAEEPIQRDVKVVQKDQPDNRPEVIGKALYSALFRDKVQSLLDSSEGMIRETDRGLRIRLHIDLEGKGLAEVASLPWEFLYREDSRRFLNLSQSTPIIRSLDVLQPPKPLPFDPPLRILVVISNPTGSAALDLDRERELIESSWGQMEGVDVHFVERPTTSALLEKLAEEDFHVLHFMGHGDFNRETGRGVLLLEDDTGGVEQVDASTMEVLLRDESTLRLVFLNACKTAMSAEGQSLDPFAGVATSLIMAGIPAVVAMQFPISDTAAIKFAGTFYRRIMQGYPVDAAMAEARKAIRVAEPQSMEWATPVLFMRSRDGVLFDTAQPSDSVAIEVEPAGMGEPVTRVEEPAPAPIAPEPATPAPKAAPVEPVGTGSSLQFLAKVPKWALAVIGALVVAVIALIAWPDTPEVASLTINQPPESVGMGEAVRMRLMIVDEDGITVTGADLTKYDVEWTSSEPSLATVAGDFDAAAEALIGVVQGVSPGQARITAAIGDFQDSRSIMVTIPRDSILAAEGAYKDAQLSLVNGELNDAEARAAYVDLTERFGYALGAAQVPAQEVQNSVNALDELIAAFDEAEALHSGNDATLLEKKQHWAKFVEMAQTIRPASPSIAIAVERQADIDAIRSNFVSLAGGQLGVCSGQRLCNAEATETGTVTGVIPRAGNVSVTPRLSVPSRGGTLHWRWLRDGTAMGSEITEQLSGGSSGQRRFNAQSVSSDGRYEVRLYNDNRRSAVPYGDLIGRVEFTVGSTGAQGAL